MWTRMGTFSCCSLLNIATSGPVSERYWRASGYQPKASPSQVVGVGARSRTLAHDIEHRDHPDAPLVLKCSLLSVVINAVTEQLVFGVVIAERKAFSRTPTSSEKTMSRNLIAREQTVLYGAEDEHDLLLVLPLSRMVISRSVVRTTVSTL
jgi:hypothetical protein